MESRKIVIDGEEINIITSISDDEIEDNSDLFSANDLEDTIEIDEIIKEIKGEDKSE